MITSSDSFEELDYSGGDNDNDYDIVFDSSTPPP